MKSKKTEDVIVWVELILIVIATSTMFILLLLGGDANAQVVNVEKREVVSRDTLLATDNVHVQEYVNKKGETAYKAKWCGRAINISKSAANDILEGSDAYVIIARYNNGEVIRQKVITLYNN